MNPSSSLPSFLKGLGIEPKRISLYLEAFTHPSCSALEEGEREDYERLEFLGDSLVGFVVSELLYRYHPEMEEGNLSIVKSQLIRTESEASFARRLGLLPFIRVGASFQKRIEDCPSVLEDVFESFIGALLLDQGLDFSRGFLFSFLKEEVASAVPQFSKNPKSELQEALQGEYREAVVYRLLLEKGPSHAKSFLVGAYFEGHEIGRGSGHSKKEAEQEAARAALAHLAGNDASSYLPTPGGYRAEGMEERAAISILKEEGQWAS